MPERELPTSDKDREKNFAFPKMFDKCPICGCTDTVCRKACEGEPSIAAGTFVSLKKSITPIADQSHLTTLALKGILIHTDVCWDCGFEYCTKAEKVTVPATYKMPGTGTGQKGYPGG